MIGSRIWRRGTAALALMACGFATAQPVGYDFNDDGYSDFPVSIISYDDTSPDIGAARIWSGASKSIIQTMAGSDTNTLFGWSYGSAGDIDGDGKDDLVVGEPIWSAASNFEGRIHVFSGDDASTLLTINGPYVNSAIGRYVTGIGDWDGDGTNDVVSSGWDIADTDSDGIGDDPIGMVFVFSGVDGSVLTEIIDPASTSGFGYSVFSIGDISGDGKADIAVLDQDIETGPGTAVYGQIYIFEGSATATSYDLTNAYRTISNIDPTIRGYAAQVDVMHPDLWLNEPTFQILNLSGNGDGGVNIAEFQVDIVKADGVISGTKGTRSSLVLSGDINLDGKVDAADLQDSISQLGTDPQAIGVMPIADSNGDNIIDATDIQVVVNGYGATTDIYEGLWDGSRLLSIAAGNSGFGSTSGLGVSGGLGGTQWGGGRRPIDDNDDCEGANIPPDLPGTMVPSLLREDAGKNCEPHCPECEDIFGHVCYECNEVGTISGGEVSVSPSQPSLGEPVVFTVQPVSVSGHSRVCKSECGPEGTVCPIEVDEIKPDWVIEIYDHATDTWGAIPFIFSGWSFTEVATGPDWAGPWEVTVTPPSGSTACDRIRLRTEEESFAGSVSYICSETIYSEVDEVEVQFADFKLISNTSLTADEAGNDRTTIGICETVFVRAYDHGDPALPVAVDWEIIVNGVTEPISTGSLNFFTAATEASDVVVVASINGCKRELQFDVKEPESIRYLYMGPLQNYPDLGYPLANGGLCATVQFLPATVSFDGFQFVETGALAVADGTFTNQNNNQHCPNGVDLEGYCNTAVSIDSDNKSTIPDRAFSGTTEMETSTTGIYGPGDILYEMRGVWRKDMNDDWNDFTNIVNIKQMHSVDASGNVTTVKMVVNGNSVTNVVPRSANFLNCQ